MVRLSGWRAALAAVVVLALLLVLAVVLVWVAIALAALIGVALLHLIYLPRLARRLNWAPGQVVLALLPLLAALGWLVAGEPSGLASGAVVWLALLVLPHLIGLYLLGRMRARARRWTESATAMPRFPAPPSDRPPLAGVACPDCGQYSVPRPGAACPSCGHPLA